MSNAFRKRSNNSPFVSGEPSATTMFTLTPTQSGQLDTTLRTILINIFDLLESYADGDFSTLAQDLTLERYNSL
mgnify:CR=1 FL=1